MSRRPSGWANPRARPFTGRWFRWTQLRELLGAKLGQRRARRHGGSLLDFPPLLQIQTKSGCNGDCVICPQKKIQQMFPAAAMSEELFHSIVDQASVERNLRGLGFVLQNEPLTDPALAGRIRLFRKRVPDRVTTFIVTNGTLLDLPTAQALLDSGLDAMHITCNGYARPDWEAVNRGKSWDDFRKNLEGFLALDLSRLAVMMSFVRTNLYRQELRRAVRYWRSRGFFCFIHGVNNRGGLVDDYPTFARPAADEPLGLRLRKRAVKKVLRCCPYPFLQMSVLAGGQVLVCTHDWARRTIVADLNRQTIREAWNGEAMRNVRLKHLSGRATEISACEHCDVFENAAFG